MSEAVRASAPPADPVHRAVGGDELATSGLAVVPGAAKPPKVSATSWVVADLDTGAVLGACGAHEYGTPASVQKLLLAAALIGRLDPKQVVTVTPEDLDYEPGSSAAGLVEGGRYTVEDLWLGLILVSGNDAANVLARLGGGDAAGGVRAMNAEAARLGAYQTHAVTPSGLDAPGQFTSAYDLALIARACFADEAFRRYALTREARVPDQPRKKVKGFQIGNQNLLIFNYAGALGGKTGYTDLARHTYVGAAERDGRRLVVSLLGAESSPLSGWQQGAALLDWGFAQPRDAAVGRLITPGETAAGASPSAAAAAAAGGRRRRLGRGRCRAAARPRRGRRGGARRALGDPPPPRHPLRRRLRPLGSPVWRRMATPGMHSQPRSCHAQLRTGQRRPGRPACATMITDSWLADTRTSYDTVAASYTELLRDGLAAQPYLRAALALFAEQVRTAGGGPVADIGCGPGHVTAHLQGLGADAFGVDLSPAMIEAARRAHPALRFEVGSMTDLDLPDASVAGLLAFWSLIHIPDEVVPTVFAHFRRVMRPGAPLLIGFHLGDGTRLKTEGTAVTRCGSTCITAGPTGCPGGCARPNSPSRPRCRSTSTGRCLARSCSGGHELRRLRTEGAGWLPLKSAESWGCRTLPQLATVHS
ncbi:methyltransferase domain-containing protein [Catellatospora bangladeshensis]|uniref:methyltransferase domain-containing protein n=1 Tax=Catellatospora bangladeshensis TaxID=310355 RepID=UPI00360B401B